MVALYRAENRSVIRRCLPSPEDVRTQRHPLYRRLLSKFERIDIKYAPIDAPVDGRILDPSKKQKDLEALQASELNFVCLVNTTYASIILFSKLCF